MQITVINLKRATERREKMQSQLDRLNLPFTFIEATDGKELTNEQRNLVDHNKRKAITPFPLSDGEIGCWISHIRAMKDFLASDAPMATIIEDDATIRPELPQTLQAIEKMDRAFDIIDLHRNFKRNEIFIPCAHLLPDCQLGRIGYTHMKATAYVISRKGAEAFLKYSSNFGHAVDKEMHSYWRNGLDLYGIEKPVAEQQDGGFSYIDETRKQDKKEERLRYPDGNTLKWKLRRFFSRLTDSIMKRTVFWWKYQLLGR